MEKTLYLVGAIVLIFVVWALVHKIYNHMTHTWTIWDYQVGLHYRNGSFVEPLIGGKFRFWGSGHSVFVYDKRIQEKVITGQEVLTSDCATLKLTAVVQWKIENAEVYHLKTIDSDQAIHTIVQLALRKTVGDLSLDGIVERKTAFGESLDALIQPVLNEMGITAVAVDVRDVMLSSELKSAYQAVLTAKKASLAKLEEARGDAAALRSLANSARIFEKNPELMQMKYLETLKEAGTSGCGNTLIIGVPEELSGIMKNVR